MLKNLKRPSIKLSRVNVTLLVVALLAIDQIVKIIVKTNMTLGEAIPVFGHWFYIRFIENMGAAYGVELGGDYGKLALGIIRIVFVGGICYYIRKLIHRTDVPKGVIFGFILILVGALGNIIDGMFYGLIFSESTPWDIAHFVPFGEGYAGFFHGAVVDMLYFPIIDTTLPQWLPIWGGDEFVFFSPIFNIADTYISVGFIYLLIFQRKFFSKK